MTTAITTVRDVAYGGSHPLDEAQAWAVLWQHRRNLDLGAFKQAIIEAADVADGANLERIARGFPALVEGITRWRSEPGYAATIRELVADF